MLTIDKSAQISDLAGIEKSSKGTKENFYIQKSSN